MARHSDDPVRHIVAFRVSSEEKKSLEKLVEPSGQSLSSYLRMMIREAIDQDELEQECGY